MGLVSVHGLEMLGHGLVMVRDFMFLSLEGHSGHSGHSKKKRAYVRSMASNIFGMQIYTSSQKCRDHHDCHDLTALRYILKAFLKSFCYDLVPMTGYDLLVKIRELLGLNN